MRRAFTLVELLVVIAIMAILVGLMLPLFMSGCTPATPEVSRTFVGHVYSVEDRTDSDGEDSWTVHEATIHPQDQLATEKFTVEDGLLLEKDKRYAFRAWGDTPPRHISEAIPIPE